MVWDSFHVYTPLLVICINAVRLSLPQLSSAVGRRVPRAVGPCKLTQLCELFVLYICFSPSSDPFAGKREGQEIATVRPFGREH